MGFEQTEGFLLVGRQISAEVGEAGNILHPGSMSPEPVSGDRTLGVWESLKREDLPSCPNRWNHVHAPRDACALRELRSIKSLSHYQKGPQGPGEQYLGR